MLVRQLEYFVAVAHEQHFARAAEACHVSQPALSDGLRRLETELGVPLIRRRHSFEGLTPEGERVVVWARRILADYKALAAEVEILRGGLSGQLRIGVVPSASATVAPLLEQFSAAHPLVHTSVNTKLSTQEIVRRLAAFELDIALCYPFEEVKGLRQQGFYEETWVLLASESMLDEVPESMTWREAGTFPLASLDTSMHGLEAMDKAFEQAGTDPDISVDTDSVASLFALVHTGRWASVIPDRWVAASGATTNLALVELTEPEVRTPIVMAYHDATPLNPLVQALITSLSSSGAPHRRRTRPTPRRNGEG